MNRLYELDPGVTIMDVVPPDFCFAFVISPPLQS
jgi:hypothetical protein